MHDNRILNTGNDLNSRYLAYGDDSQYKDILAYAFIIVDRHRVNRLADSFVSLKKRFRIPDTVPLHCRVLFSGDQRKKFGLNHLNPNDVKSLINRAISIMNRAPVLIRYCFGNLTEWQNAVGKEIELYNRDKNDAMVTPITSDPKGIMSILMQGCFAVAPDGSQGPTASECQIITSQDSTKVRFIGNQRKRADRMYSGFSSIGAPKGQVFRLNPTILKADDEILLQVADIASYICSHATSELERDQFFREQHDRFRYWHRMKFHTQIDS